MNKKIKEILKYLFFGGLTTLVNIVIFFYLDSILNINYLWANFVSILISILFAYITNKLFVFESITVNVFDLMIEFFSFISFRFLSGVIDMLTMWGLVEGLLLEPFIAKISTQVIIVLLNYIFSKYFIFKNKDVN